MIKHRAEFDTYIASLPLKKTSSGVYRNWVNRIDRDLPADLDEESVQSERDVIELAAKMPVGSMPRGHIKDVRCLIRYYLKFLFAHGLAVEQASAESEGSFDSSSTTEARRKALRSIAIRRGRRRFRDALLAAYSNICCVTGTSAEDVLEAAHIKPYAQKGASTTANGLLLRSDIHVLFDLYQMSIKPDTWEIYLSPRLRSVPAYRGYHGTKARKPKPGAEPDQQFMKEHFEMTHVMAS